MKMLLAFLIFIAIPFLSFSQVPDSIPSEEETFILVENSASFPGGLQAWGRYLSKNLKYPLEAKKKRLEGRVYVQFIVERDGSLSEIKVVKSLGSGCDEEALRVIKMMPKWEPATKKGVTVRQRMIQNILFKSF